MSKEENEENINIIIEKKKLILNLNDENENVSIHEEEMNPVEIKFESSQEEYSRSSKKIPHCKSQPVLAVNIDSMNLVDYQVEEESKEEEENQKIETNLIKENNEVSENVSIHEEKINIVQVSFGDDQNQEDNKKFLNKIIHNKSQPVFNINIDSMNFVDYQVKEKDEEIINKNNNEPKLFYDSYPENMKEEKILMIKQKPKVTTEITHLTQQIPDYNENIEQMKEINVYDSHTNTLLLPPPPKHSRRSSQNSFNHTNNYTNNNIFVNSNNNINKNINLNFIIDSNQKNFEKTKDFSNNNNDEAGEELLDTPLEIQDYQIQNNNPSNNLLTPFNNHQLFLKICNLLFQLKEIKNVVPYSSQTKRTELLLDRGLLLCLYVKQIFKENEISVDDFIVSKRFRKFIGEDFDVVVLDENFWMDQKVDRYARTPQREKIPMERWFMMKEKAFTDNLTKCFKLNKNGKFRETYNWLMSFQGGNYN